jgi:hypothetical protein
MDFFKGKLPGFLGYPGMFMQFKDYLDYKKGPTTTIDGTPLQTQLETLRNGAPVDARISDKDLQFLRNLKIG